MAWGTIYALVDPVDDHVVYVGQTRQLMADRLRQHKKDRTNPALNDWLKSLDVMGLEPVVRLLASVKLDGRADLDKLNKLERTHIRRAHNTNKALGLPFLNVSHA